MAKALGFVSEVPDSTQNVPLTRCVTQEKGLPLSEPRLAHVYPEGVQKTGTAPTPRSDSLKGKPPAHKRLTDAPLRPGKRPLSSTCVLSAWSPPGALLSPGGPLRVGGEHRRASYRVALPCTLLPLESANGRAESWPLAACPPRNGRRGSPGFLGRVVQFQAASGADAGAEPRPGPFS